MLWDDIDVAANRALDAELEGLVAIGADTQLHIMDTSLCPVCSGEGAVLINRSRDRDPQNEEWVNCGDCNASGMRRLDPECYDLTSGGGPWPSF
jgi:hypothetical protein